MRVVEGDKSCVAPARIRCVVGSSPDSRSDESFRDPVRVFSEGETHSTSGASVSSARLLAASLLPAAVEVINLS